MARIYIERQKSTVAQWVELRPLFDVCEKGKGYNGGGLRRKAWWRQEATEKNFGPTWQNCGKLKGGLVSVGRWALSRTGTGREREDEVGSRNAGTETRDAQVGE